tara:strand:- start:269 stop:430 length:162 start_codon:yes stop_codon:yes gene_type:complete
MSKNIDIPPLCSEFCSEDEQANAPNHEHFWSVLEKLLTEVQDIKDRLNNLEGK